MARLAFSPNASQPRPAAVLPSHSEQEPFPAPLHGLPGVGDTVPAHSGRRQRSQELCMGPGHVPRSQIPWGPFSALTALATARSQSWHFHLWACTADDVPGQGGEKGGICSLAGGDAHVPPQTAGWEEVPLGGGLQHLHPPPLFRPRLGSSEPHSTVPQDLRSRILSSTGQRGAALSRGF